MKKHYSHWEIAGIPYVKPKIPFGNLHSMVKRERSFGTAIYDLYKDSKESFLGIYVFFKPAILVRDAELVKNMLTRDFEHFHDRGMYCEPEYDPMSAHLFALTGEAWKNLRSQLTPAFTSGKLKGMFPIIQNVGDGLVKVLNPLALNGDIIEIRDLAGRYVIDCLASIAFGQEGVSTLQDPGHEFRMNGIWLNDSTNILNVIGRSASFVCPGFLKVVNLKSMPAFMKNFCVNMVTKTIDHREKNNIVRDDLMQYLIDLRNNTGDKLDGNEYKTTKNMSYVEIAAHVFIFYFAGNESSTSTISYTLYELCRNKELMNRAQDDIKSTLKNHQGQLTYESIMDMKFIDLCVKETLRKYPFPMLHRKCTKDYPIPGSNFTIQKGTPILISVLGLHRDEQFFPNPEKYDPDRFTDEKKAYDEDMYMPFGSGPKTCIAYRMGLLVSKTAIVKLLMSYNFEATCKKELEFDYGSIGLLPKPGQCKFKIMPK